MISNLSDKESGGDNALDGFGFQVSSAIYLAFEQYRKSIDFELMYEKLEDFIIINNKINLYQSKGVSFNITPHELIKNRSKTKKNESIIEKMYDNFLQVKREIENISVETNLIICENTSFSKMLWDSSTSYDKNIRDVSFSSFSDVCKERIQNETRHKYYEWNKIKARRVIPKSRHEEITRIFIDEVITEKKGENKINSAALYQALVYEINKIRKDKSSISGDFLDRSLSKYVTLKSDIRFENVNFLLNEYDRRNLKIKRSFEEFKNTYNISNNTTKEDYNLISSLYDEGVTDLYELIDKVESSVKSVRLLNRIEKYELQALSLLLICNKEGIK